LSYSEQSWVDGPEGGTPIDAARLTHMEVGIEGDATAEATETARAEAAEVANAASIAANTAAKASALAPLSAPVTAAGIDAVNTLVPVTLSTSFTRTLPTAPADKSLIQYKIIALTGSSVLTIAAGGTDVFNATGGSTSVTMTLLRQAITLQYYAASHLWYVFDGIGVSGIQAVGDIRYDAIGLSSAETTRATTAEATEVTNRGTAITGEVTARNTAIGVETTRATAAEGTLTTNLAAEVTNRGTAVTTETTRATTAEGLAAKIANNGSDFANLVTFRTNTAIAATTVGATTTAVVTATSGTITAAAVGVSRVAPAAAITGVILQAGTISGQQVVVINESVAASTITFAASGTSHVADGVSDVIAGLTARTFVYDTGTSLWYRVG
jgi:hypothetical protein